MMKEQVLFFFAALLSLSMAQCTGNQTTASVSVSWNVVSSNSVMFSYSAPSTSSQYTILAFSESAPMSISQLTADFIYATGDGNTVDDRYISGLPVPESQQDLTHESSSLSNNILTVNFTRPIISTDKNHDIDLNACRYIGYGYGGNAPLSIFNLPTGFGFFPTQICLQNCNEEVMSSSTASTPDLSITPLSSPSLSFIASIKSDVITSQITFSTFSNDIIAPSTSSYVAASSTNSYVTNTPRSSTSSYNVVIASSSDVLNNPSAVPGATVSPSPSSAVTICYYSSTILLIGLLFIGIIINTS